MRFGLVTCALTAIVLSLITTSAESQAPDADQQASPLRVDSTFVWVPALVTNKGGRASNHIDISRFRLLDNGSPQRLAQINTAGLPVSLVILMQTGGAASRFLPAYTDLPELIDRLLGNSPHEITFVTFDSRLRQIWHFPKRTDGVNYALTNQQPGDKGVAIRDAVAFGVRQLQNEPGRFRRIVLLLSQEQDVGSAISSQSLLEQLGSSSTVVYSLIFPGEKAPASGVHGKGHPGSVDESLGKINRALEDQTAQEAASLTGGGHFQFDDQPSFNSAILQTIEDFRNQITLGFQPTDQSLGLHRIELNANLPESRVTARTVYWHPGPG